MIKKEYADMKEYVLDLFEKDDDCFEYFKEQCKQNGVNIFSVVADPKFQHPHWNIPYMCIYVTNEKDYNEYEVDFGTREMLNDSTKEKIIPLWYETCKLFNLNLDEFYHPQMPIGLKRIDHKFYSYFTREHKQEITDIIVKETSHHPEYVFSSSYGYISIIFTEEQYADIEKNKDKLIDSILNYTNTVINTILGDVNFQPLSVCIYHLGMEINLYGLSRED